jgi:adenosylcobinamide-GDP ribazoletransferase
VSIDLWRDLEAALGCLTVFRRSSARPNRERLARAMLFFPVVGAAIGATVAGCALALAGVASHASLSIVCVLLMSALSRNLGLRSIGALAGALRPGATGEGRLARLAPMAAPLAVLVGKITMLAATAASLVSHAVFLAAVLGRWAPVVLAHGARPVRARAADALAVGRVGSREFAWASVIAMGASLAVGEAVGLLAVIAAALTATGLRIWAYRGRQGMTAEWLAASIDLAELAVLAVLAASSPVAAPR